MKFLLETVVIKQKIGYTANSAALRGSKIQKQSNVYINLLFAGKQLHYTLDIGKVLQINLVLWAICGTILGTRLLY